MVNDSPDSNILYYENRELELLKNAMNIEAKKRGERIAQNPVMKEIIGVLEKFLRDKKLVCYGGTAINNCSPLLCGFNPRFAFMMPFAISFRVFFSKG